MSDKSSLNLNATRKIIGGLLVIASVLIVFSMAHHPSGAHGSGGLARLVHGAMILLLSLAFGCMAWWSIRRGLERPLVLFGLIAYAINLVASIGAATVNGFVVPALAAHGVEGAGHENFRLLWELNQALAGLGVYATGAAYLLWGLSLVQDKAPSHKTVGALAIIAGLVPAALLATSTVQMNVSGAFIVYGAQMIWIAIMGVYMWRTPQD